MAVIHFHSLLDLAEIVSCMHVSAAFSLKISEFQRDILEMYPDVFT
jgi:hypothetical protein